MKTKIFLLIAALSFIASNSVANEKHSISAVLTCKTINSVSLDGKYSEANVDEIGQTFMVKLNKDVLVISTISNASTDFTLETSHDFGAFGGVGFSASGYSPLGYDVKVQLNDSYLINTATKAKRGTVLVSISKCDKIN